MLYLQTPNPTMTEMQARKKGEMKIGEKKGKRRERRDDAIIMTPLPVTKLLSNRFEQILHSNVHKKCIGI